MSNIQENQYYLIVGPIRSGTTFTHLCLKGHPEVAALNDEVRPSFFLNQLSAYTYGKNTSKENDSFPLQAFDILTRLTYSENPKAQGMKIAFSHGLVTKRVVSVILEKFRFLKIIRIQRNDPLGLYYSVKRAELTGMYHSWNKTIEQMDRLIKIERNNFDQFLANQAIIENALSSLCNELTSTTFCYETDLLNNNYQKLYSFLGLTDIKPDWNQSEKVSFNIDTMIKDYQKWNVYANEKMDNFKLNLNSAEVLINKSQTPSIIKRLIKHFNG